LSNVNRLRGIGRYTASLVESLLQTETGYHFLLFGYGPEPDPNILNPSIMNSIEWREIPRSRNFTYPALLVDHLNFARAVKEARLDLFHGIDHNMTPFLDCPNIVTVHDLIILILRGPYLGPKSYIWMKAHHHAALNADRVVAVSRNTKHDVQRIWGIPSERISVVPEGVSGNYHPIDDRTLMEMIQAEHGIKKPYLLYLGGFDPRKNLHNMLLSFKRFLRNCEHPFQLVLCGDTEGFRKYLRDEIDELGLGSNVVLTGYMSEEHLPALYSGAEAFLFLSLYEGFGLPLLEVMACGTPVLASNKSSIPEVVGKAALLVDPLNPADIANGLQRIVFDRDLRQELRKKGLQRSSQFTWDTAAKMILEIYHHILGGGGGD